MSGRKVLKVQLTDKEFQKLAAQTGVSQYDIQKLYSMGVLRERGLQELLIRYDYDKIRSLGKYRPSQIISRLVMYYHVSREVVSGSVYNRTKTQYYCEDCGKLIKKSEYKRNDGLCDDCVSRSIELP